MTVREAQSDNQISTTNDAGPETQETTIPVTLPQVITLESIRLEQQYDVQDSKGRWCEGEIIKIDRANQRVFVHYTYWDFKFDEWVDNISNRIVPVHTHTYVDGGELKEGQRIEVLDDRSKWLEAFIIDENDTQIKIHYKGFHAKYDEWLTRSNTTRIRQYGFHKYQSTSSPRSNMTSTNNNINTTNGIINTSHPNAYPRPKDCILWSTGNNNTHLNRNINVPYYSNPNGMNNEQPALLPINARIRYINEDANRQRKITNTSNQYQQYTHSLAAQSLSVIAIEGDGNCLFRAVSHQIYGDQEYHAIVRAKCMDYMELESDFFSQFVEGGKDLFPYYVQAKRMNACWGDDPEIEALCELYNRPVEIWAFDPVYGARKLRTFHENINPSTTTSSSSISSSSTAAAAATSTMITNNNQEVDDEDENRSHHHRHNSVIRLSYYGGGHYDSIVHVYQPNHYYSSQLPGQYEDRMMETRRLERVFTDTTATSSSRPMTGDAMTSDHTQQAQQVQVQQAQVQAEEQRLLRRAIDESRKNYLLQEQTKDDLETALLLSLKDNPILTLPDTNGGCITGSMDSANAIATAAEVIITDEEAILQSVARESERDYLESALLTSLLTHLPEDITTTTTTTTTMMMMDQQEPSPGDDDDHAAVSSSAVPKRGDEETSSVGIQQTTESNQETAVAVATTTTTTAAVVSTSNVNEQEAQQLQLVQELSTMSEEEIYQLAIQQSLQAPPPTITTTTINPVTNTSTNQSIALDALSEEEMIRMAMEASLAPYSNPSSCRGVREEEEDMDAYDEALMLAIQASLK